MIRLIFKKIFFRFFLDAILCYIYQAFGLLGFFFLWYIIILYIFFQKRIYIALIYETCTKIVEGYQKAGISFFHKLLSILLYETSFFGSENRFNLKQTKCKKMYFNFSFLIFFFFTSEEKKYLSYVSIINEIISIKRDYFVGKKSENFLRSRNYNIYHVKMKKNLKKYRQTKPHN